MKNEEMSVGVSKDTVNFNDQPFLPTDVKNDTFEIMNLSAQKIKYELSIEPNPFADIQVQPLKGQIGKVCSENLLKNLLRLFYFAQIGAFATHSRNRLERETNL